VKAAGSILYLLLRAVLELLMLPVHLIVFLVRREEIRREIRQALEQDR
jgi:predicted PurR-regulated permease PerM